MRRNLVFYLRRAEDVAHAKDAPVFAGDTWTWAAIDSDSKLIVSYMVGGRDSEYAIAFIDDLRARLDNRVQLHHRRPQSLSGSR